MDITVRDKTFRIDLVNNMAQRLASEIKSLGFQMVEIVQNIQETNEDFTTEAKDMERVERRVLKKKYKVEIDELSIELKEKEKSIINSLDLMMSELLIHNGYEYDKEWWLHKTSQEDKERFWTSCINKDAKEEKPKVQKKKKSSTKID